MIKVSFEILASLFFFSKQEAHKNSSEMGYKSTSLKEQILKLQRTNTDSSSDQDEASQTKPLRYATKVSKFDREVRKPYCTDFGADRDIIWKDYLFCDNCKKFERDSRLTTRKISRSCAFYECLANHRSFDHPTTLKDGTQKEASQSSLFFHFHERKEKKLLKQALRICRLKRKDSLDAMSIDIC